MTATLENAIFRITSREETKNDFGTGFIIKQDENASYLLTCAHVVENLGGKSNIQVGAFSAEVIACGSPDGIDLAILKVDGLKECACLPLRVSDERKVLFFTRGFSSFAKKQYVARTLEGKLGDRIDWMSDTYTDRAVAWDLYIEQENSFPRLMPGYSGSPVCDKDGNVFAVISHRRDGKHGHAISIANLEKICPELFSELLGSQSQLTSTTRLIQEDYKYEIFLSYAYDGCNDYWIENYFIKYLQEFLTDHFAERLMKRLKREPKICLASHEKNDTLYRWKEELAYSRCLISICSRSYFKLPSSQYECSVMLDRETKLGCRTLENPWGLFLPVIIADSEEFMEQSQKEKIPNFNCHRFRGPTKSFGKSEKHEEYYDKLTKWVETKVIASIKSAPSWREQWLKEPAAEIHSIFAGYAEETKFDAPNMR